MHSLFAILPLIFFLARCSRESHTGNGQTSETLMVEVLRIDTSAFTLLGTYYGQTEPAQEAQLICYAGGRVETIRAREGDMVKSGASLAEIDSRRIAAMLNTARLQEQLARWTLERTESHATNANASQFEVDQARLALLGAEHDRIEAQRNYRGSLAIAPFRGIVAQRFIEQYQELPPGSPTFTVARFDTIKVALDIPVNDAPMVKQGTQAVITIDAMEPQEWRGEIRYIARQASSESRTFRAVAFAANPSDELLTGVPAHVVLTLREIPGSIVIPAQVMQIDGPRRSVFVVDSLGFARKRSIEIGPFHNEAVLVTSGLSTGELLIVSGQQLISDGDVVRIKGTNAGTGRDAYDTIPDK